MMCMIMEDCKIQLLLSIMSKLPSQSLLYVGDYINNAFNDGCILDIKRYLSDIGVYKNQYDYCFKLSSDCILYLEQELIKDDSLIDYFCHYAILHDNRILLKVYDGHIFSIDKSLNISCDLLEECENGGLTIYEEEFNVNVI